MRKYLYKSAVRRFDEKSIFGDSEKKQATHIFDDDVAVSCRVCTTNVKILGKQRTKKYLPTWEPQIPGRQCKLVNKLGQG